MYVRQNKKIKGYKMLSSDRLLQEKIFYIKNNINRIYANQVSIVLNDI
jgi:hypothetical protein